MGRPRSEFPAVTHHKPTGQARVRIAGRDYYLGRFGSRDAKAAYARLMGEVAVIGVSGMELAKAAVAEPTGPTVNELCLAFVDFVEATYRKGGRKTSTCSTFKTPVRVLRELYGRTPAKDFSPIALDAVRNAFIKAGISRGVVNQYAGNVRRIFRWGTSRGLVPVSVVQSLECLDPLRAGRTEAPERRPVPPVSDEVVEATLPFLSSVVAAMVRLQRLTGMRPGELCSMRPCEVDTSGEAWLYRPSEHKTMHKDRDREIYIGPLGQKVLAPFLDRPAEQPCFSPAESAGQVRARRHANRVTPATYGNTIGSNRCRKPVRAPGDRYDVASYRRAIWRACEQAFAMPEDLRAIPSRSTKAAELRRQAAAWRERHCWAPNQLRHTAGTAIREEMGIEAAQALLGHSRLDVTQVYAEKSKALAREAALRLG